MCSRGECWDIESEKDEGNKREVEKDRQTEGEKRQIKYLEWRKDIK